MALALPEIFPDLSTLANESDDRDFFSNVAHLQLHRRTRALGRLVKARVSVLVPLTAHYCTPGQLVQALVSILIVSFFIIVAL